MCADVSKTTEPGDAVEWHSHIATDFDSKYSDKPQFIARDRVWSAFIEKYSNPNFSVLDIGCGSGVFTFKLAEKNRVALGIDGSDKMLEICEAKKARSPLSNISFAQSDISALKNVAKEHVDIVVCSSVLEYVDDLPGAFDTICSLINTDGYFIVSMPNIQSLYRKFERLAYSLTGKPRYYRYVKNVSTFARLKDELRQRGFEIIESAYYGDAPAVSKLFRPLGLSKYADNLFAVVAKRVARSNS